MHGSSTAVHTFTVAVVQKVEFEHGEAKTRKMPFRRHLDSSHLLKSDLVANCAWPVQTSFVLSDFVNHDKSQCSNLSLMKSDAFLPAILKTDANLAKVGFLETKKKTES